MRLRHTTVGENPSELRAILRREAVLGRVSTRHAEIVRHEAYFAPAL